MTSWMNSPTSVPNPSRLLVGMLLHVRKNSWRRRSSPGCWKRWCRSYRSNLLSILVHLLTSSSSASRLKVSENSVACVRNPKALRHTSPSTDPNVPLGRMSCLCRIKICINAEERYSSWKIHALVHQRFVCRWTDIEDFHGTSFSWASQSRVVIFTVSNDRIAHHERLQKLTPSWVSRITARSPIGCLLLRYQASMEVMVVCFSFEPSSGLHSLSNQNRHTCLSFA